MRIVLALACVLVGALGRGALADARINDLIKGYQREAGTCQKNARGVRVVIERGRTVSGNDKELADDLAELAKAQATVQGHCDELESTLELLKADPGATYKQLARELDERDKRIRSGRAASRLALADAEQRISRSVPRINKLIADGDAAARLSTREQKAAAGKTSTDDTSAADKAAAAKAATTKVATATPARPPDVKLATFPSGHRVELPAPAEAWTLSGSADTDIADYAFAGAKATVLVRRQASALTCDQVRASLLLIGGRASAKLSAGGGELETVKPAWMAAWSEGDTQVRVACVSVKGGVVIGRTESSLVGNAPLATALARMITVNLKR